MIHLRHRLPPKDVPEMAPGADVCIHLAGVWAAHTLQEGPWLLVPGGASGRSPAIHVTPLTLSLPLFRMGVLATTGPLCDLLRFDVIRIKELVKATGSVHSRHPEILLE